MKRGFPLIEILVVLSIIALLIGILLPALGSARRTTKSGQPIDPERLRLMMEAAATQAAATQAAATQAAASQPATMQP